jgi:hypothetical protein
MNQRLTRNGSFGSLSRHCSKVVAEEFGQVRVLVVEPGLEAKIKKEELRMMNYGG